MKLTLFAAAFVAVAATSLVVDARRPKHYELTPNYSYEQYLVDFGKTAAADPAEYRQRLSHFKSSLRAALEHNLQKDRLYHKGINHMSDMTPAEKKAMRGGRATQMAAVAEELKKKPSYLGEHQSSNIPLPVSFDVRGRYPAIMTAVKNQGQCGSCWAHGTTEAVEAYWAAATGNLFVLSTQQLTACAPNPNSCGGTGGCGGSIFQLAMDYIVSAGGQSEEWATPYTAFYGTTGACPATIFDKVVRVVGYKMLTQNSQPALMDALVSNNAPIVVNVDASQWSEYEAGVFDGCNYANNISIDHVVNLVGYGAEFNMQTNQYVKYFTIRNSWSAGYGENGFIRIIRHDTPSCGLNVNNQDGVGCAGQPSVVTTCGQCGILYSTGYPIVSP